jgi:hypothetical protein
MVSENKFCKFSVFKKSIMLSISSYKPIIDFEFLTITIHYCWKNKIWEIQLTSMINCHVKTSNMVFHIEYEFNRFSIPASTGRLS